MITVNGNPVDWQPGMTVQKCLDIMGYDFVLMTVFINEKYVSEDEYTSSLIPDGADVKAIHLHHGG